MLQAPALPALLLPFGANFTIPPATRLAKIKIEKIVGDATQAKVKLYAQ
jgi:hypothetical protein